MLKYANLANQVAKNGNDRKLYIEQPCLTYLLTRLYLLKYGNRREGQGGNSARLAGYADTTINFVGVLKMYFVQGNKRRREGKRFRANSRFPTAVSKTNMIPCVTTLLLRTYKGKGRWKEVPCHMPELPTQQITVYGTKSVQGDHLETFSHRDPSNSCW